ncbi:hypothetical protein HDV05_007895 [Chytridiales sp. JEL 0842]|nr:hypothetical protein HDV05_007895 [Chytridiales sp. JEL 0842]
MSERKVLNKYFPPDFDPSKIPRRKMPKEEKHKVRLMTPFSMRCEKCGDYIYKGKKFNAMKERVEGEDYLGIHIFRFYIRCPRCALQITFKTDPMNSDYVAERGAQRNFEPWREGAEADEEKAKEKMQEEENNPMKALENRTLDSKREMDILDALDEIRTKNAQNERVDAEELLDKMLKAKESLREKLARKQEEEDDAIAKAIFKTSTGENVKRLWDESIEEEESEDGQVRLPLPSSLASTSAAATPSDIFAAQLPELQSTTHVIKLSAATNSSSSSWSSNKRPATNQLAGVVVKKAAKAPSTATAPVAAVKPAPPAPVLGALAGYGSDSD